MKTFKISKPKTFWIFLFFFFSLMIQINFSCGLSDPPEGSRAKQAERGAAVFKEQCARCHGMKNIAPTVDSLHAPDLTQIKQRRGVHKFPIGEVARIIDGRNIVKAHGPRPMPVWGEVYKSEGMDETEIKGKKGELVAYLMSIQKVK